MILYLLRHGEAERPFPGLEDAVRALTPEGVARLERQAAALARSGLRVDRVLTSPLVRARQTAALVASALGTPVAEEGLLRPRCTLEEVTEMVARAGAGEHLLCVGHEPDLSEHVLGLTGSIVVMRPGMLAVIEVIRARPRGGVLLGLYDPDVLVRLGS
jgi:phosphohistidine phosphatase